MLGKPLYLIAAIVLVAVVIAAVYLISSPVVTAGDTIGVYYTGAFTNGTVFGSNVGQQPLNFTVGTNQLIEGFDNGVIGMRLNQNKTLVINDTEAYGEVNPNLVVEVPVNVFGNQTVKLGMEVTQTTNGTQVQGIVQAVNDTTATINFNSPLAGHTLVFQVKVVSINPKQ